MENLNLEAKSPSKIKVFGVGGGGSNAVNRMYQAGLNDVELYIVNTDLQHLNMLPVPNKIHIGENITKGLGAGAKPEIGEAAAKESINKIKEVMDGADMVFIAAGLGGGTGTGASPILAQVAKELGILTVAVTSLPFGFEGPLRRKIAEEGLNKLKEIVDTYLVINNDKVIEVTNNDFSMTETFKLVDDILYRAVRGITDIIYKPGLINVDFADVKTIMEGGGKALIGIGSGTGKSKIENAVKNATTSPLLEGTSIKGARRLLVNVEMSPELSFKELNDAISQIRETAHEECQIIFGATIDNEAEDEIRLIVVATELEGNKEQPKKNIKPRKPLGGNTIKEDSKGWPEN
jgi:cell division protein FtsZ